MKRKLSYNSDDLLSTPGTYFNPVNEMLVIVSDTNYIDVSNLNLEGYSGDEWFLVSEDALVDETNIEEVLQTWQLEGGVQTTNQLSQTAEEQQG